MLTFILVGAGTVGVEPSTIAEMARMALAHDFRHLNPGAAQILLFDGAPRILPTFAEDLSAKAHCHLQQLGVKIFTGTRVENVDAEAIAEEARIRPNVLGPSARGQALALSNEVPRGSGAPVSARTVANQTGSVGRALWSRCTERPVNFFYLICGAFPGTGIPTCDGADYFRRLSTAL